MAVSILHRATGIALATGGLIVLTAWLVALASGPATYDSFLAFLAHPIVHVLLIIVGVGITWSFFQHMCSGLRHFVLDTGAGYELKTNRTWATLTFLISTALTALVWVGLFLRTV
jgi:succinate dehydrogenase / fumarate reductase cytochrome b subunit